MDNIENDTNMDLIAQLSNQIDPNEFTYKDFKRITSECGITIKEFTKNLKVGANDPIRYAEKHNGVLGSQYYHLLIGMIAVNAQSSLNKIK